MKLKLILKGILLYTTILCTLIFICMFDSEPKIILICGFILFGLYVICYIFIDEDDIFKLMEFIKL